MEITRYKRVSAALLAALMLFAVLFGGAAPALAAGLSAPTGLAAETDSSGKVSLQWNAVSGALGYAVYRADSLDGEYTIKTMAMQASYTDSTAVAGNTYYYKVSAFTVSGISFSFGDMSEAVSTGSATDPGGLEGGYSLLDGATAKYEDGKVLISWPQYQSITNYIILRSEATDPTDMSGYDVSTAQVVFGQNSYVQSGAELSQGKTYWYLVKPIGSSGDVLDGGKIVAYTPIGVVVESTSGGGSVGSGNSSVPTPTNLEIGYIEDIQLVWTEWEASDVAYYEVYRAVNSSAASAFSLLGTSRTYYYDDDIEFQGLEGKTLYYYVVAVSEQEERSNASDMMSIYIPGAGGGTPSPSPSASPSSTPVATPSPSAPAATSTPAATNTPLTPTPSPTPSPKPSPTIMPTPYMPSPDAPYAATKPVAKALTLDSIQISWTRSRDAQFYHIYRADDVYNTYTEVAFVDKKVTKWVDHNLPHDGIFYYYITAEKNGVESDKTSIVSAAVGYNIYNLTVAPYSEARYDGYNLSWDAFPAARTYYIYVSNDGVSYTYLASTSRTYYNHRRINNTLPFWYKVVSNNGGEANAYSAGHRGTMEVTVFPTEDFDNMGLRLNWSEIGQSSYYLIQRSTDNVNFTQIAKVYGQRLTYLDVPLNQNTTYYYRVVASNGEIGQSSATTKMEFLMLWATATGTGEGNRGVQLKWNAITGASSYTVYRAHKGSNQFVEIARTSDLGWLDKNGLLAFNQYEYKVVSNNGSERTIVCGTLW